MTERGPDFTPWAAADALWLAAVQTAQVPMVFTTSCWNAMVETLWPIDRRCAHPPPDHRLSVPEALEDDPAPGPFA